MFFRLFNFTYYHPFSCLNFILSDNFKKNDFHLYNKTIFEVSYYLDCEYLKYCFSLWAIFKINN